MCALPVPKIGLLGTFNDQMTHNATMQHPYASEDAIKGDFWLMEDTRKFRFASAGHPCALCPG